MSVKEEQIWSYIDGTASLAEKARIGAKIANDCEYKRLYENFMTINQHLANLEFDEPSMSFTRNVMDKVKAELKPVSLQTKVNHKIIYGIVALFAAALFVVVCYALSISDFNNHFLTVKLNFSFEITKWINATSLKIFLFIDLILALVCLDSLLRKIWFKSTP